MTASATGPVSRSLQTTWALQQQWSKAADGAKSVYVGWGRVALAMSILAATLATATSHVAADPGRRALAAGSAVLVSVLAVIGRLKTGPSGLRNWVRARSASEGLKTEAYGYMTRTGPYAKAEPEQVLAQRTNDIAEAVKDLNGLVAGVSVPNAAPPADKLSIDTYLQLRVDRQISTYYAPNAAREARLVSAYRRVELVLAIVGAALTGWASVVENSKLAPWAAVVTTAIAGIAAHLAAGRHEYQVTTYAATRLRLQQLADRFRDLTPAKRADADQIDQLVSECEAVISVENQGWMAQWEKPAA
jgi:hypothetical protein